MRSEPSKVDRCHSYAGSNGRYTTTVRNVDDDGARDTAGKTPVQGARLTWNVVARHSDT
jgi:hypothetical protein